MSSKTNRNVLNSYIIPVIFIILLVVIDQLTKFIVISRMTLQKDEIPVIGNAIVLHYIRNSGAAWGSFSNKTIFLIIISIVLIIFLGIIYKNIANLNKFMPIKICIIFIIGGAIGNLIDRIRLGYVIDFIYAKFIDFPVFNFADICVTVCMFVILFLCIFKYDSDDLDTILGSDKKKKLNAGESEEVSEKISEEESKQVEQEEDER